MMTRRRFVSLLLVVSIAGCTKSTEPADPVWGKEPCAHCAMIVGDARFAAQAIADGERKFFDDIGCMVLWLDEQHRTDHVWVRDAAASRWIDAKSARYVDGAKTPMDFGFEAKPSGGVGWSEMRDRVVAKRKQGGSR